MREKLLPKIQSKVTAISSQKQTPIVCLSEKIKGIRKDTLVAVILLFYFFENMNYFSKNWHGI
jgi:hypothetical protein